jgi:outer membrane protein with beta-barrel domain
MSRGAVSLKRNYNRPLAGGVVQVFRNIAVSTESFDAPPAPRSASRSTFRRTARALALTVALAAIPTITTQVEAQTTASIRPTVGVFVPTGDQRDLLKDAILVGIQGSYNLTQNFALTGTFGWSPNKDQLLNDEKVDLFQYDLGIEGRLNNLTPTASVSTRPYATLGAGARTYHFRDLDADSQTNFLGFGAVGVDLAQANGPIGLRIEARDNVTAFKGLESELAERKARNDLQFTAGLTIGF